jgi:pimeloyl-ACP methyl ester carboxylesterase
MSTWLLLRGLTREAGHWGEFPRRLGERLPEARVVALDLPGNGRLYRQQSPRRVEAMAEACRAEFAARGIEGPYHLLAMSLGAMVAVAWAGAHPAELAGCVLINASFGGLSPFHRRLRPASYPSLAGVLAGRDARAREAAILRLTSRLADPAVVEDWVALRGAHPVSRANALRQLAAAARFRLPVAAPAVPMLVLCGAADALVDPRCSAALAARWRLPLAEHPAAGHDLPLDDGRWVAARIADWFAGQ